MFNYFLGGAIFALPLFLKVGSVPAFPRYSHEMFLILISVLSTFFFTKESELKLKTALGLFALLAFFNAADFTSLQYLTQIVVILPFIVLCSKISSQSIDDYFVKNCIGAGAIVQSIFAVLNVWGVNSYGLIYGGVKVFMTAVPEASNGTLGNANIMGAMLAMSLPVFFRRTWLWFSPVVFIGIYLSGSVTPWLIVGASVIGYLWTTRINKILFLAPVVGVIVSHVVVWGEWFNNHRIHIWTKIIAKSHGYEIFGRGTGFISLNSNAWKLNDTAATQAHNEYIELFYTYGLMGVALVTAVLWMRKDEDKIRTAILSGGIVGAFTHFELHVAITSLLFAYALFYNYSGVKCAGTVKVL